MRHERLAIVVSCILGISRPSQLPELILPSSSSSISISSVSSVSIEDEDSFGISEQQTLILPPPSSIDPTKLLIFQYENDHYEVENNLEPFVTCTVRDDQSSSTHLFLQLSTILNDLYTATAQKGSSINENNGLYEGTNEIVEMAWSLWDYAKDCAKLMRRFDKHIYKLDQYKVKLDCIIRSFEGIPDKSYQDKVDKKIEKVKGTIGTADFALETLTSIKLRYGMLLNQVGNACMSALLELFNDYETAVNQLGMEAIQGLASLEEGPPLGTDLYDVSDIVSKYSKCHSGYHRVRSVISGLSSTIEGLSSKGVLLHPMLQDLSSTFKRRLDLIMQAPPSTTSLEAQINNILAGANVKPKGSTATLPNISKPALDVTQPLSVFDVYSPDFDYEQYRLEFWHHSNLDDVNFVGDTDPVFKQYFTKTLSRHGSTLQSPEFSEESDEGEDFDSIGKILRDFKRISGEDFFDDSSSGEDIPPVQQITFHLLMGMTWVRAAEMPDCFLVNPDNCPHSKERQKLGKTLISPPINMKSCLFLADQSASPTDPESTGRSYEETIANLKGLRELRRIIVDQFVTAIRMKMTKMIVGKFGCAGCGVHLGQVAMIYDEVASVLKGHSLTQIYFADSELFSALAL